MIGPVSETGKTMLSSLQGAMSKGMPVDQAIQYVKSQAATGVAPLVDLYALLKQFERLKQPPAQPPQGGNLKEQLNSLESSLVGGLGGMRPGAAPAQPQMSPEMQGLGSLNAGAMENPSFAGGGIVAFAEGGQPEAPKSITPELYKLPQSYEEMAQQAMREQMALETPEGRAAFLAKQDAELKEAGLGPYAKSLEMRDELAKEAEQRAGLLPGEEAALNEESFWADVAGSDAGDLVSAMAKSKAKAVERKRASREKVNAAKEKAAEEKVLRQEAREALKQGDINAYKTKLAAANTLRDTKITDYVKAVEADADRAETSRNALRLAEAQKGEADRILRELRNTPRMIDGKPNPKFEELSDLYSMAKGGPNRAAISYRQNIYNKAVSTLKTARENHAAYGTAETQAALDAAIAAEARAREEYEAASLGQGGGVSFGGFGGSAELPPGFNLDQ
jgi:hypothetical protein